MDIDFPLVLVTLTFITGVIYLLDILLWQTKREAGFSDALSGTSSNTTSNTPLNTPSNNNSTENANEEAIEIKTPWLIETSRSFFPVLAIVLVLRSFLLEPFQIPSGSMLPTLEVGDFILVNKFNYGIRLPVLGTKVIDIGEPQRGDIMVFKYPKDHKTNYIKRVVGLPGDILKYKDKTLWINGKKVSEDLVASLPIRKLFEEKLGDVTHQIYQHKTRPNYESEGAWRVPDNSYFMMGDNRDNSNDSRFWGFVPEELIVGRAFAIWMHWPTLVSLPSFHRVGGIQ